MRWALGILATMAVLAALIAAAPGCATWHDDWEAKCGPDVDPLTKPCSCMDPRTPTCPPPPSDAKRHSPDGGQTQ